MNSNRMAAWPQHISLAALLGLTLFPFYMLLINSLKDQDQSIHNFWGSTPPYHWDNYASAFAQVAPFIMNSIIVTAAIVAGVLLVSSLAGFSFAMFDFPGKTVLYLLVLMLMMVPGFLILIPQFLLVKQLGMLNTYQGQFFPPMAAGSAMATMLMRTAFESLPKSLFESARLEGAGELRLFLNIAVPLSLPIFATVAIINGLGGWNNYIWPLVCTTGEKVKPVIIALNAVTSTVNQGDGVKLAGFVITSLPLIALFLIATKPFINGITSGAVKG